MIEDVDEKSLPTECQDAIGRMREAITAAGMEPEEVFSIAAYVGEATEGFEFYVYGIVAGSPGGFHGTQFPTKDEAVDAAEQLATHVHAAYIVTMEAQGKEVSKPTLVTGHSIEEMAAQFQKPQEVLH